MFSETLFVEKEDDFYNIYSEDGEEVFGNWEEDPDSQQWDIPWIIKQDWTTWQFTHVRTVQTQAGTDIHLEAYRPGYGTFPMVFSFEGKELKQVQRTITDMMVEEREEDGILAVYSVQTFILEETDREGIEKQMKLNGPVPELVSLYRELDALQAAENVHFVYDTEKDNVYGGWDTRHQEFLKWGNTWYWDSDMLSEYGEIYIKYLWYGAKMHKWAHSNTHGAPQHRWKKVEDRLELPHLLTKDWRALQVLNIQEADGSTIITIQGDPTDTETMTYYSLTYQFYLDQDGKLTKMVANHHVNEYIQQVGNVDTKAISTATILDTSDAEIQDRVQTVWAEVKEALD